MDASTEPATQPVAQHVDEQEKHGADAEAAAESPQPPTTTPTPEQAASKAPTEASTQPAAQPVAQHVDEQAKHGADGKAAAEPPQPPTTTPTPEQAASKAPTEASTQTATQPAAQHADEQEKHGADAEAALATQTMITAEPPSQPSTTTVTTEAADMTGHAQEPARKKPKLDSAAAANNKATEHTTEKLYVLRVSRDVFEAMVNMDQTVVTWLFSWAPSAKNIPKQVCFLESGGSDALGTATFDQSKIIRNLPQLRRSSAFSISGEHQKNSWKSRCVSENKHFCLF